MVMKHRRAIFIEKDGALLDNIPHNVDPERMQLNRGAATALPTLYAAGYALVAISNQSGVAHGYITEGDLAGVEVRLREMLGGLGVPLAGFYYCPHHPEGLLPRYARSCACRKPRAGMLRRAARDLNIDLSLSWVVGDILDDVEAGHVAGCASMLIDDGAETEWRTEHPVRRADAIADDLAEAALIIASWTRGGIRA